MSTTKDLNSTAAVQEALDHSVGVGSFVLEMYDRMRLEMHNLPHLFVVLTGEVRRLRVENDKLAQENQTLKERIESLKNR